MAPGRAVSAREAIFCVGLFIRTVCQLRLFGFVWMFYHIFSFIQESLKDTSGYNMRYQTIYPQLSRSEDKMCCCSDANHQLSPHNKTKDM